VHATLCDLMMDLVQNSVEADATLIELSICESEEHIEFELRDNGNGMNSETQARAIDPFYSNGRKHAHRRVGLGLPLLFQTAEAAAGEASIQSEENIGTVIRFRAQAQHVDLPPFGDFTGAAAMMLALMPSGEFKIIKTLNGAGYTLARSELEDVMGDLQSSGNLRLLKTYIASQEEDLRKAG
jgi:hypothetical protein